MSVFDGGDQKEFDELLAMARHDLDVVEVRTRKALLAGMPEELVLLKSVKELQRFEIGTLATALALCMLELAKRETPIGGLV